MSREIGDKLKVKRVRFSLLPQPAWVIAETMRQLPKDALIVNVGYEYEKMSWCMFVQSDKFERITEGGECPEIVIKVDHREKKVDLVTQFTPESFLGALEEL